MYMRAPNGGKNENLSEMTGFDFVLLTMQHTNYELGPWETIIQRAIAHGIKVYPWAFLWKDEECIRLRRSAEQLAERQNLTRPAGCWNAERPLADKEVTIAEILRTSEGCDLLLSTTPWAFEEIREDYELLPPSSVIDIQMFPSLGGASLDPRSCRSRFYQFGFRGRTQWQHGIVDGGKPPAPPAEFTYPERGTYSLYTSDDVGPPGSFTTWEPSPELAPLPTTQFPYPGALYGPSHSKWTKTPTMPQQDAIRRIKRALHNSGFWDFPYPDGRFNVALEKALKAMQRQYGINPTGQFGLGSWERLRRLPHADRVSQHPTAYSLLLA
jgi:peptidoglycan hydrolase-like protein with peptidoglycan-binding domain